MHVTHHEDRVTFCVYVMHTEHKENTLGTHTPVLVTHSHNTQAFTHSPCDATVTLDTGSPPPCGGCHVGMRHTDTRMTEFSQGAMFNVRLIHNRRHWSES